MNRTLIPGNRSGCMVVPASKSQVHRMLICAALSHQESTLSVSGISKDITATIDCLGALGANINFDESDKLKIRPLRSITDVRLIGTEEVHLYFRESGSTLLFLVPLCGAIGCNAVFHMEGRLAERPLGDLITACENNGMSFSKNENELHVSGKLQGGQFTVRGNVSSQFITGLLFALPLLEKDSVLEITGKIESGLYIKMTEDALRKSGIRFEKTDHQYFIKGGQVYAAPALAEAEKDWSGAAFPLCIGALSEKGVTVSGLDVSSAQGDSRILDILSDFGAAVSFCGNDITVKKGTLTGRTIEAWDIPDLVPVISVVAAVSSGTTRITGAGRLRFKESDRIQSTVRMINSLGGYAEETEDGLIIQGTDSFMGGSVFSYGDHRIAMSASVAACISEGDITVIDAECTEKSFPGYWEEFDKLEVDK